MINNIIKEEIEEEEENSSKADKNTNEIIYNENKSYTQEKMVNKIVESSKEKDSIVNISDVKLNKEPKDDDSVLSEDILPIIYSKYQKKYEKKKSRALITNQNLNLDEKDDENRTILHRACLQIKLSIIKDLAPKLTNVYVNQLDKYGNSPLILACKYSTTNESKNRQEILNILIKNGANIHCIEPINGWTALHWCCYNGDLASVKLLISYGSNYFLPSKYGFFTIDLAGRKLFYELVSYLIKITTNYLQKIGEYELLDTEHLLSENINRYFKLAKNK
jgi:ankyrin repeat protein